MEVFWLEGAVADISEIVGYIARANPAAASRVAAALHHAAARLGTHPRAGRRGRVAGTRELVVPRLRFVIAYRMKPDRIEVVRAIHGRRNWRAAFRERA
jgi:plasmid stabilization system protein ParE